LKMSKTINTIPEEVKDRFKALKVLYDEQQEIDNEEEKLYRQLELKSEKEHAELYELRRRILLGLIPPPEDLLAQFETRAKELDDEDFKKLEVNSVDVKDIQNTPLGVYGFWRGAMLNMPTISRQIFEKDRTILLHLQDVRIELHPEGYGFDIFFAFEKNDYFSNEVLKKSYILSRPNVIEKCIGSEI